MTLFNPRLEIGCGVPTPDRTPAHFMRQTRASDNEAVQLPARDRL